MSFQEVRCSVSPLPVFSPYPLLILYRGFIRPCIECIFHVWGVESKAFRLIDCLQPSILRRNVAFLAIFYRYFHANCPSELPNCMPLLLSRTHCTRLSTHSHPYSVYPPNARVNQYLHSFFSSTGKLWNSLPKSVFPPSYHLIHLREEYQDTCNLNLASIFYYSIFFREPAIKWVLFISFCMPLAGSPIT